MPQDGVRRNEQIRAREVRVIGADSEQLGILGRNDAIALAREHGLDLVEVAAAADPPVCRIMDYGKFKYETQKKKLFPFGADYPQFTGTNLFVPAHAVLGYIPTRLCIKRSDSSSLHV